MDTFNQHDSSSREDRLGVEFDLLRTGLLQARLDSITMPCTGPERFDKVVTGLDVLVQQNPNVAKFKAELVTALCGRGNAAAKRDDRRSVLDALENWRRAEKFLEELNKNHRKKSDYGDQLAKVRKRIREAESQNSTAKG